MHLHFSSRAQLRCQAWVIALALSPVVVWAALPAEVPPVASVPDYVSPLSTYQSYAPAPAQDWAQANQTVHDIGGWRAYAREPLPVPAPKGGRP